MSERSGQPLSASEMQAIDGAFSRLGEQDYYELLGVERGSSPSDVKKAYYRVSKSVHPDRFFRRPLGNYKEKLETLFDLMTKAYNTLSDADARATYDKRNPPKAPAPPPPKASDRRAPRAGRVRSTRGDGAPAANRPRPPRVPRPQGMPAPKPMFRNTLTKQLIERQRKARKYLIQGKADVEAERYEAALSSLQLAASFDPRSAEAKKLIEICRAAVADTRAEAHYQKGLHHEMLGSDEAAKRLFQMAVDCKPKKGYYYAKLATVLRDKTELRARLEALKMGHQYDPKNVDTLLKLADAYEQVKMPRNALREFEKVLLIKKGHDEAEKAVRRLKSVI